MQYVRQYLQKHYRNDNLVVLSLLVLAVLLIIPAIRSLHPSAAQRETVHLQRRIAAVVAQAQLEHKPFTITLLPGAHKLAVARWITTGRSSTQQAVSSLSMPLRKGTTISETSLPMSRVVISETGFLLTSGFVVLRAKDGSKAKLMIRG